jgi:hypothetical protein
MRREYAQQDTNKLSKSVEAVENIHRETEFKLAIETVSFRRGLKRKASSPCRRAC